MASAEGIMGAFGPVEETGGAATLAELVEKFALAPREQFMHVALVSDIEDELIGRRIEDAMECDGELNDPEVWADVAAIFGGDGNQFSANFLRQLGQLLSAERFDISRSGDV